MNLVIKRTNEGDCLYDSNKLIARFCCEESMKYTELLLKNQLRREELLNLIASAVKDYINSPLRFTEWLRSHCIPECNINPVNWHSRL